MGNELIWTEPRTWVHDEDITVENLNELITQMKFLQAGNYVYRNAQQQSNLTVPGTHTVVSNRVYTYGTTLVVKHLFVAYSTTTEAQIIFDMLLDNSIYYSTLTGTPGATGAWGTRGAATKQMLIPVFAVWENLTPGYHDVELKVTITNATTIGDFDNGFTFSHLHDLGSGDGVPPQ